MKLSKSLIEAGRGRSTAEDQKIKEEIALKLIKPEIASDKNTFERFRNELKLALISGSKNSLKKLICNNLKGLSLIGGEYIYSL